MKTMNRLISVLGCGIVLALPVAAWSQQEAVTGSYDSKNDWIVFQWLNATTGKQQATYDSSNKVKPTINTAVAFDQAAGVYTYSFQFGNLAGAAQLLQKIFISHPSAVSGSTTPSSEWDGGEYRNKGIWEYDKSTGTTHGIPAGQSVSGFSFKSKGLPAIVDVSFTGKRRARFNTPSDDYDTQEVQTSFNRVFEAMKAQYPTKFVDAVKQKTVGPVDPPATFNAASAIQNLIALVNQSRAPGWIDNDGIVTSLLAKLNNAASKVGSDKATTKNVLGAFLSDVSAQNGKHLTAEAYALLFFNGQYVVNHL
ncbi:MAG: hypothetical protein HY074_07330 [Deltaproteobacteria bacterium]|nr:hypothetical protein [Deltaproteobacteria bacterium]